MAKHLKAFLPAGLCLLLITLSSSSCKNNAPVKEGDFIINNKELIFKKAGEGDHYHQGVLAGMYLEEMYYMYIKGDKNEAYKWAKKSSDNNHPFGLYNLAEMYNSGAVVGKDENRAKELYLEAYPGLNELAESGDQIAQYYLSNLLISGKGVMQDTGEGSKWLQKAAEQGNAPAQFHLGISFAFKLFDKPELEKYNQGIEWLHKAAEQGLPVAQFMLAEFYMKPAAEGVSPNYNEAIKWYRKLADNGDVETQLKLADIYYNGKGVQKDHTEAANWFQKAADQGNSEAQYKLGYMYEMGQGVQLSFDEAAKWYQKAADQGNSEAQLSLAIMYYNGQGVQKSYEEAAKWFRKAADQGESPLAQMMLGILYNDGLGVQQNYEEAAKWFRKAADQGDRISQNRLGSYYYNGLGVQRSYEEAAMWFRKAADQKHPEAMYYLGILYLNGQGVQKSYEEAAMWFRKAADQGNAEAKTKLEELKNDNELIESLRGDTYEETVKNVEEFIAKTNKELDEERKVLESQIKKADEIKQIEDYYANMPGVPDSNTIIALCERYYTEAEMGGERDRCLQRFVDIIEQTENNVR